MVDYSDYAQNVDALDDDCEKLHTAAYDAYKAKYKHLAENETAGFDPVDNEDIETARTIRKGVKDLEELRADLENGVTKNEDAEFKRLLAGFEAWEQRLDVWRVSLEKRGINTE